MILDRRSPVPARSRCRGGLSGEFPVRVLQCIRSGIGYRLTSYRTARPAGNFVRNSRIPKRARPARGCRCGTLPRTPAPARTGEARSKPGLVLRRNRTRRRGPSPRRHTVSSHARARRGARRGRRAGVRRRGKPLSVANATRRPRTAPRTFTLNVHSSRQTHDAETRDVRGSP